MLNTNRVQQVNLWEVVAYLKVYWRFYVFGGIFGAVLGIILFLMLPPKYEASVVIQPARIGSIIAGASASTVTQGNEPEPAALMIERLKVPSFFGDDIRQRCQMSNESGYQKAMVSDLSASVVKLPNPTLQSLSMAKLTWKAVSPEVAEDCIGAIIAQLAAAQDKIIAPAVATLTAQKEITKQQLQLYLAELEKVGKSKNVDVSAQSAFSQIVIADKAAQNLRESVATVRKQLAEEEAQLSAPYTQSLSKLEPIYASREPTITFKVALSLGALIGMLLGVCALLIRRSVLNAKAEGVR